MSSRPLERVASLSLTLPVAQQPAPAGFSLCAASKSRASKSRKHVEEQHQCQSCSSQHSSRSSSTSTKRYTSNDAKQDRAGEVSRTRKREPESREVLKVVHWSERSGSTVQNHVPVATWWLHGARRFDRPKKSTYRFRDKCLISLLNFGGP